MAADQWIEIPNWHRFQHYRDRRPLWIKVYLDLLRKDEYMDLPLAARGLLHGIWLAYADWDGQLRVSDLTSALHARCSYAHLELLNHAGLIAFSASRPLSLKYKDIEVSDPKPAPSDTQRRQKAERWITNGAAAEVPAGHLAVVLEEDFHIHDQAIVRELVELARARYQQ